MLQVVFSDSEKGSIHCALHFSNSADETAYAVGYIANPAGSPPTEQEQAQILSKIRARDRQVRQRGKALGGAAKDIAALCAALDIGNICFPADAASRKQLLMKMFEASTKESKQALNQYWDRYITDLHMLSSRAAAGEPVRIWYSSAPYSMCGFYHTIWLLKDYSCKITAIKLPLWDTSEQEHAHTATSWGEICPGDWARYLPLETEIPDSIRTGIAQNWEQLKNENAPLRAVINGRLHSVGEDFYDNFIRKEIPKDTFKVSVLIGKVLGRYQLGIGDWWVAQRVRRMIADGELAVVKENDFFYETKLKKNVL